MARTSTRTTAGKRVSKPFVPDARPTDSQTERTWSTPSVVQVPPTIATAAAPNAAPVRKQSPVRADRTDTQDAASTVLKREQLPPVQQRSHLSVEDLTDDTDVSYSGGSVTPMADPPNRPSSTATTLTPSSAARTSPDASTFDLTIGAPDENTTTLPPSNALQTPPRRKKKTKAKQSLSNLAASIDLATTVSDGTPALSNNTLLSTPIPGKKKGKKAKRSLSGVDSTAALSPVKKNKTALDSTVHAAKDAILSRHPRAADLLAKATKLATVLKIGRILDAKRASRKASPSKKRRPKSLQQLHNPGRPISTSSPDHPIYRDLADTPVATDYRTLKYGPALVVRDPTAPVHVPVREESDSDRAASRDITRVATAPSASNMQPPILTDLSALTVGMANIITKCSALGETLQSKNGKPYRQAMVTDESCPAKRLIAFGQSGCDKLNNMSVGSTVQLTKVRVTHGNPLYSRDNVQPIELQVNDYTSKDFAVVVLQSHPVDNTPAHITALHAARECKDGDMINVSVMVRGRRFVDSHVPGAALSIHLLCVDKDDTAIVLSLTGAQSASFDKQTNVPVMLQARNVLVAHDGNSTHLLAVPLSLLALTNPDHVTEEQRPGIDFVCPYFLPGPNDTLEQGRLSMGRTFVSPKMLTMHAHWWPLSTIPTSTVLEVKNADSSPFAVNVVLCQVSVSKTRKGTLSVGLQVEDNTCTLWMNAYTSVLTVALSLSASELERLAASGELLTMLHEKCKGRLLLRLRLLPRLDKPAHVCIQEIVFVDDATVVV